MRGRQCGFSFSEERAKRGLAIIVISAKNIDCIDNSKMPRFKVIGWSAAHE
jgi:hypothetical protein